MAAEASQGRWEDERICHTCLREDRSAPSRVLLETVESGILGSASTPQPPRRKHPNQTFVLGNSLYRHDSSPGLASKFAPEVVEQESHTKVIQLGESLQPPVGAHMSDSDAAKAFGKWMFIRFKNEKLQYSMFSLGMMRFWLPPAHLPACGIATLAEEGLPLCGSVSGVNDTGLTWVWPGPTILCECAFDSQACRAKACRLCPVPHSSS